MPDPLATAAALLSSVGYVALAVIEPHSRRVVVANDAFAELVGIASRDVVGVDLLAIANGEEHQAALAAVVGAIHGGHVASCHGHGHVRRATDGEEIVTSTWIGPLDGLDVRDYALVALAPVDARQASAVGTLAEPLGERFVVVTVDHGWLVDDISADAAEVFALGVDFQKGAALLALIDEDDIPLVLLALAEGAARRRSVAARVRVRARGTTGAHMPVDWQVTPLCDHYPPRYAIVMREVRQPAGRDALTRAEQLESHLWRIALEVRGAGLGKDEGDAQTWWEDATPELSPKQWAVLYRLLAGASTRQIAKELFVATSTVRNHLAAIYRKFGVHTRSELTEHLARLPLSRAGEPVDLRQATMTSSPSMAP